MSKSTVFYGTKDKLKPNRHVMIVVTEHNQYEDDCLIPNTFTLMLLRRGTISAIVNNQICHFNAPSVICLDEQKKLHVINSTASDLRIVSFDPTFLNINMEISTIRNANYSTMCDRHAFFQLTAFMAEDADKFSFPLAEDTLTKINASLDRLNEQLVSQPDWYWSCKSRSYFIDIINIIERKYFNYYTDENNNNIISTKIPATFIDILTYINNHLDESLTFEVLYDKFFINKNCLSKLFKKHLSITFLEYLRKRRFEEASYYLRFTELSGELIATRIGFSSSQNFCRFFKSQCGKTPNEFRNSTLIMRKTDKTLLSLRHS